LTVKNGVTTDSIFSCVVTSDEWLVSNNATEVIFNIFGEYNKLHSIQMNSVPSMMQII